MTSIAAKGVSDMEPIRNKVAESEIEVFDLESLVDGEAVVELDLAAFLVEGLVLREKEFRSKVKDHDWSQYAGNHVAITCSTDAIVPTWAYMLIGSKLEGIALSFAVGPKASLVRDCFVRALDGFDWEPYRDRIVVVKGCGSGTVPPVAYLIATGKLQLVAQKIMYGEPCSSVPIWRRPSEEKKKPSSASRPVQASVRGGRS